MEKQEIYDAIKRETEKRGFSFESIDELKNIRFAFKISNKIETIYGIVFSNEKEIYQGMSEGLYNFFNTNNKINFVILVDKVSNHFLAIPFDKMKKDFPSQGDKNNRYKFSISRNPYQLTKSKIDLIQYQDNLDIIFQELTSKKVTSEDTIELTKQQSEMNSEIPIDEKEVYVFVTGYDGENLEKSKKSHILGWIRSSNFLSKDSLVFVFDKTNLFLDSCFRVLSKSYNNELIWADEIKSGQLIYPNRWETELIQDSLRISLSDINRISPFDKEPFQGLLRGNFPMPLNSPQNKDKYKTFRKFILDKLINYWIFIVADQPKLKLSSEEIYQTRMNDKFWGLNEHTPYRKQLKKGDLVIFCHGAKKFLGTAKIETNCFEPTEEQKIQISHDIDFYKPKYGVMLSEIERWQKLKEVVEYVSNLTFIPNIQQFPVYFQGGIKKIKAVDYNLIIGKNLTKDIDTTNHYNENKWLSLIETDIEKIIERILTAEDKRLEIDENIIKRIIPHLVLSKHVILVGPPGTGKTDLARRILRELGKKIIDNPDPIEAVASYEWGRYEVIGGRTITSNEGEGSFHFGCVTNAIYKKKLLLIDEFNRADMNKAFGEMFLALDHGEIQLREDEYIPNSNNNHKIQIPTHFRMICTMNDYDKSLLNELSYGLLRRFAFVEINVPDNKEKVKNIVIERTHKKLQGLDKNLISVTDKKIDQYIDKFIDFMFALKLKREIGLSSYIDVISYFLYSSSVMKTETDIGAHLNSALIDYILPQFDRLDIETLRLAYENALNLFRDETKDDNRKTIESRNPLLLNLKIRIERLEELNKLFKFGESV